MDKENTLVKGLFAKMPPLNAPNFVLLNLSIKPHELYEFLQPFLTPESRGWVNLQILRSKDGSKIYGKVDTYKKQEPTQETQDYNDRYKTPERIAKDEQNQREASQVFNAPLSDEELDSLANMSF